ncbi:MAG: S41 family peptidase [Ruminococcaceae bacterium]|nr:S41 family peptidase [Oscillospiraceae bacterium]
MYKLRHLILTGVCCALVSTALCGTVFLNIRPYTNGDTVMMARKILMNNYVNPLTEEQVTKMNDMAISGMVASLGDQYSRYLNEEDMAAYEEEKKETYVGIGVSVNFDVEENVMTVVSPYDGSPAQKAGLLPGDIVLEVAGVKVTAESYDSVLEYIKKGEDEEIALLIGRGEETIEVSVKREEIKRQSVSYKMYGDGIGRIRVSEFIQNTAGDFENALNELKASGMRGLIIDLRSNPGGYADTVLKMTDKLLPEGVIAYLEDNHGKRQYFHSDEECLDIPMVVLINQGTASASELMAGSLKAHDLATIIGEKSYGKAVGQSVYPLTATTAIYLTNSRYFTPNGECIDKIGITPDIQVSLPVELIGKISYLEPEEDPQLAKAIEVLLSKIGA